MAMAPVLLLGHVWTIGNETGDFCDSEIQFRLGWVSKDFVLLSPLEFLQNRRRYPLNVHQNLESSKFW